VALSKTRALVVFAGLIAACHDEAPEPVPLYHGQWIDILGVDRTAEDTCEGTFEYVDAYARVLAAEFGIDGPIGSYVWYTREEYDSMLPCGSDSPFPISCTIGTVAYSAFMPLTHEMVHISNHQLTRCPDALAEGLAVYYSTDQDEGRATDVEVLAEHLANPSDHMPWDDYEMLGRLSAFLVEEYGLPAVLEVCRMVGRETTGPQLAEAMQSVFGAGPDELLAALSEQPVWCDDFDTYQSKVFACGVAPATQHFGLIEDNLELTLEVGCDRPGTFPTALGDEIQHVLSFDAIANGAYLVDVTDAATSMRPEGAHWGVSRCGPCERWQTTEVGDDLPLATVLNAGRHILQITLPKDFSGTLRVLFII
jgi:hypothetical protein